MFSQSIWRYLFVLIFAIIFMVFYTRSIKKRNSHIYELSDAEEDMPANIWFYSKLVSMEIGEISANQVNLYDLFLKYLYRKYFISQEMLEKKTIFEIVNSKESDPNLIELYGEIWFSIESLKAKNPEDVIKYIKTIKSLFNKEYLSDWIEQQKKKEPCNDC